MNNVLQQLQAELAPRLDKSAYTLLAQQLERLSTPGMAGDNVANQLAIAMPALARRIGAHDFSAHLPVDPPDTQSGFELHNWTCVDAARVVLILHALAQQGSDYDGFSLLKTVYRYGDDGERTSMLKAWYWLDPQRMGVDFAVDAERTNSSSMFAAIAQHNPYPACCYSEAQFNQLVIKAIFMGLNIEAVAGLRARRNAELSRICCDFIDERLAAQRTVPQSLWLALRLQDLPVTCQDALSRHLGDNDPQQRYFTARCLSWQDRLPARWLEQVQERAGLEDNPTIVALMADMQEK